MQTAVNPHSNSIPLRSAEDDAPGRAGVGRAARRSCKPSVRPPAPSFLPSFLDSGRFDAAANPTASAVLPNSFHNVLILLQMALSEQAEIDKGTHAGKKAAYHARRVNHKVWTGLVKSAAVRLPSPVLSRTSSRLT